MQSGIASKHLNSGDCFVIVDGPNKKTYIWRGQGAHDGEYEFSELVVQKHGHNPENKVVLKEGEETDEFWACLGGKEEYSKIKDMMGAVAGFEPRLFNISNSTGYTYMKEVPQFTQKDLLPADCYILDIFTSIYIWIGNKSNKFEQHGAHKKATQYLETIIDGRDKSKVHIIDVQCGQEPPFFCVQFPDWSDEIAEGWSHDTFEMLKAQTKIDAVFEPAKIHGFQDPTTFKVPYAQLKGGQQVPGVKGSKREDYLTDEEFETVFGMKRDEYNLKKVWDKNDLKKKHGLL